MRLLVVIAGPNGSGKSTLLSEVKDSPYFPDYLISPDELVKRHEYDRFPNEKERYIAAMNDAEYLRNQVIENGLSLAFETVFSTSGKNAVSSQSKRAWLSG